jgi:hypothetical protein
MSHNASLDPTSTQLRPLAEYAHRIPSTRLGKRLNRATLWRWALHGANGVRLRTQRLGGGRYTTDADVVEFMRRLSEPSASSLPVPASERGCTASSSESARILQRFAP